MYGKGKVTPLPDLTRDRYNIEYSELAPGSHQPVMVSCTRCGETFSRERRKIHQLHACPTHITREDGVELKWCNKCKHFKPYQDFSQNAARHDGMASWCQVCSNSVLSAQKHNTKSKKKRKTFDGWLASYLSIKSAKCRKHGIKLDLDTDYLHKLWSTQGGKCHWSRIPLQFNSKKLNGATLDRMDSALGYTKGNVVWAAYAVNSMRGTATPNEFGQFLLDCQFNEHLPIRLECKKLSSDAQIPSRKRTTDVGYDLYSTADVVVPANGFVDVPTGIAISVHEGFFYTIAGRSGLWRMGISPFGGILDATYTGEVFVGLRNNQKADYQVRKGDRIAQLILHRAYSIDFTEVENFSPNYRGRDEKGFGSSGK